MSKTRSTNALALCGILLAVTLLLNYLASFHLFRIDEIFYLISGALVYHISKCIGIKAGCVFYAASAILSFVLVPDKAYVMFFIGVFGPCAIVQALFFKAKSSARTGRALSAVLSIVVFIIMFYLFAFIVAYGGGFLVRLGLPVTGTSIGTIIAIAFGLISAIIAFIVNRNLSDLIDNRFSTPRYWKGSRQRRANASQHIDLPKLYREDED